MTSAIRCITLHDVFPKAVWSSRRQTEGPSGFFHGQPPGRTNVARPRCGRWLVIGGSASLRSAVCYSNRPLHSAGIRQGERPRCFGLVDAGQRERTTTARPTRDARRSLDPGLSPFLRGSGRTPRRSPVGEMTRPHAMQADASSPILPALRLDERQHGKPDVIRQRWPCVDELVQLLIIKTL